MTAWRTLDGRAPRIIAHRGASGYLPEHTMPAYALAARQGADVIEPDLVMSRDGVLYAHHDLFLSRTTDIAEHADLAARARTHRGVHDWWTWDLDATELDRLCAVQRWPRRDHAHDRRYPLLRFGRLLDRVLEWARQQDRVLAIYPEIKHPQALRERGHDPLPALAFELESRDLAGAASPVWLQCLDHAFLQQAHARCGNPCFALFEHIDRDRWPAHLHELSNWASGVAPDQQLLHDAQGRDSGLVAAAHDAGLQVHAWTFRDDAKPAPFATSADGLRAAFALGVDALFCDFPDTAVAARTAFANGR